MDTMDVKKMHYKVLTDIWKQFRVDLDNVADIHDAYNPRWVEMVARYEQIYQDAPRAVRAYANDMRLVHVAALEAKWRWKD